jgi:hypothetical protein
MPESPIERSLKQHFSKHRIVFWYDAREEWASDLERLKLADVEAVRVKNNELGNRAASRIPGAGGRACRLFQS